MVIEDTAASGGEALYWDVVDFFLWELYPMIRLGQDFP
jgi:hypothetical protein